MSAQVVGNDHNAHFLCLINQQQAVALTAGPVCSANLWGFLNYQLFQTLRVTLRPDIECTVGKNDT